MPKDGKILTILSRSDLFEEIPMKNPQISADNNHFVKKFFLSSLFNEEYSNHKPLCVILVIFSP